MALSFNELRGVGQAHSGDYGNGLGTKKSCCSSCADGGPCTGCGGGAGHPCRCKGGGMKGYVREDDWKKFIAMQDSGQEWSPPDASMFSPAFGGMGATTTIYGQDMESPAYGYGYAQTTKKNTTVMGKPQGLVPQQRRADATRLIEQLEFLAGTPGVHPRVLAQKAWQARKALMESPDWSYASYASPFARYDSSSSLKARLASVERVLGIDKVSPKIMAALNGMSGGLGIYDGPSWLQAYNPVDKLASCIRAAICAPNSFCCPPGTYYDDPYYDEPYPEPYYEDYPEYYGAPPAGGGGGDTWIPGGDPGGTLLDQVQPKIAIGQPLQPVQPKPKPQIALVSPKPWIQPKTEPKVALASPTTTTQPKVALTSPTTTTQPKPVVTSPTPAPKPTTVQPSPYMAPVPLQAPKTSFAVNSGGMQQIKPPTMVSSPTPQPYARQATQYQMPTARSGGLVVGSGPLAPSGGTAVMLSGLGARRATPATAAMERLRNQLRQARLAARARRR